MFDIRENLKKLPDSPGVYMHKDIFGEVIYVGKAKSLKKRVSQYFGMKNHENLKVANMVKNIASFEVINCKTETEALILEDNLIKRYRPKYNVLLRDDKTYPYIKLTTGGRWPRVMKTRILNRDGHMYFGPYSKAGAVNLIVDLMNDIYSLKRCSAEKFPKGFKPCLNYHMGKCDGMCIGLGDDLEYSKRIEMVKDYLKGNPKHLEDYLKKKMNRAAETLHYEDAAKYRDYLGAAKDLYQTQRVALRRDVEADVLLIGEVQGSEKVFAVCFSVREGRLVGREKYWLKAEVGETKENIRNSFIKQHYGSISEGPKEILVERSPEEVLDGEIGRIEEYLRSIWGRKVRIYSPMRGKKRALMELAAADLQNMVSTMEGLEEARNRKEEAIGKSLGEIIDHMTENMAEKVGGTTKTGYRVEAYDISNTNGIDAVGAMVVFLGNNKETKAYRRFKVKTVEGPDDYGSMQEVLFRRLKRGLEGSKGFLPMPDLILLDGGRGHVQSVMSVMKALKLNIPTAGMVKDDRHRTNRLEYIRDGEFTTIELKDDRVLYSYIGRIQEEVHRFAISYHRKKREERMYKSPLDKLPGVGAARKRRLIERFGTIDGIREASVEELQSVDGISRKIAENISETLREEEKHNL